MVAFFTTLLLSVLMMVPVHVVAKRRPVGTPVTWGEAMVGASYVFFIFFWVYGVFPHQWLTWADGELGWRADRLLLGPNSRMVLPITGWTAEWDWFPIVVSAETVRDVIATLIYVVLLGLNIWYWAWWQNRGKRAESVPVPVSQYGRPLMKRR